MATLNVVEQAVVDAGANPNLVSAMTNPALTKTASLPDRGFLGILRRAREETLNRINLDPEWAAANPDKAQAELTRQQWDLYQKRYAPLEDQVLAEITDPTAPERAATEAGDIVSRFHEGTRDMTLRRLARYGVAPTEEEAASIDRHLGLARALAISGAKNTARSETRDMYMDLLSGTLDQGKGLSSAASAGLNAAASMQSAREQAAAAQKAAHQQSMLSSALTGAGLAAAAGAGAMGIAGGAGAGLALALL